MGASRPLKNMLNIV